MGIFIVIFLILYMQKQSSFDQRRGDISKIIRFFICASIIMSVADGLMRTLVGPGVVFAVFVALVVMLIGKADQAKRKAQDKKYGLDQEQTEANYRKHATQDTTLKSFILPKPVVKRRKMIARFSKKYDLNLTQDQVKAIADASYMSHAWKLEVEAMDMKYDAVHEWFQGDRAYVRAYLRAFPVQDISTDFARQYQIVLHAFNEVFDFQDQFRGYTVSERIEKVNSHFYTDFDEVTFMIAYRFLQSEGYEHVLDTVDVICNTDHIDELLEKYQTGTKSNP